MATRIYKVSDDKGNVRLVEAISRVHAISHVVTSSFTANVLSQKELIDMVKKGVTIEEAEGRGKKAAAE